MQLLSGQGAAQTLLEETAKRAAKLKEKHITPTLALLQVGEEKANADYAASIRLTAEEVGVDVRVCSLPADCTREDYEKAVQKLNADASIHGILPFLPLEERLQGAEGSIAPQKDVDGITDGSASKMFFGTGDGFIACTAEACLCLLDYYNIDVAGKRAVVIGRSRVVGKPVSILLLSRDATVTICHTRTQDLPAVCREADLLVVTAGCMGLVGKNAVKEGAVVLDVGTNWDAENGCICGDVDFEGVKNFCRAITPVPGGVGLVTSAVLMSHVVTAAESARA